MIVEAAVLHIKHGQTQAFEQAFRQAEPIISGMKGYQMHELKKCVENDHQYLLLVRWDTLEDHTIGFRTSEAYLQWKQLLHHFYDPFPVVEHYF